MSVHEVCWKKKHTSLLQQSLLSQNHNWFPAEKLGFSLQKVTQMVENYNKKIRFWNYFAEIFLNVDIFEANDLGGSVLVFFGASWSIFCGGWGG